jgi:hypothetical protein
VLDLGTIAAGENAPLAALVTDRALATEVQGRLVLAGLLDPPVDGKFGPVSSWAIRAFCDFFGLSLANGLTRDVAGALLDPAKTLPLQRTDDFAGRVADAMLRKGYWICRHPSCCNIIYVEGCDEDGRINDDAPNKFNDLRLLIRIGENGRPEIVGKWSATTSPGSKFVNQPLDPGGAARIALGQFKAWVRAEHNRGKASAHDALVQVEEITVYRDLDKNYDRAGDKPYTGIFGINQHWGFDYPVDDIRDASAGCLVGRTKKGHREFMQLVSADPRYAVNNGYRFLTAILSGKEL